MSKRSTCRKNPEQKKKGVKRVIRPVHLTRNTASEKKPKKRWTTTPKSLIPSQMKRRGGGHVKAERPSPLRAPKKGYEKRLGDNKKRRKGEGLVTTFLKRNPTRNYKKNPDMASFTR